MASKQVQLRRGTTAETEEFTGAMGEVTVDTTKKTAVVHDGEKKGGYPLAKEEDLDDAKESIEQLREYTDEALQGISAGAPMYLSVAVGISETIEGDFFSVAHYGSGDVFYSTLFRHGAEGFAEEITKLPGTGASLLATNSVITKSLVVPYAQLVVDTDGALRVLECVDLSGRYRRFPESSAPAPVVTPPTEYVVFLCAGQSNMNGRGDAAECPVPPAGYGYAWQDGTGLVAMDSAITNVTMLPAFVNEFVRRTGLGVIVVKYAVGGSAMAPGAAVSASFWGDTGGGYREAAVSRLRNCLSFLRSNGYAYQFGGILWSQGERDAQAIDTSDIVIADYDAGLANMMAYFRGELGGKWPFYFVRTGRLTSGDTAGWQAIRDAQDRACATDEWVMMGYTGALRFPQRGLMKTDGIHYSQAGLNECGTKLAAVAATLSTRISIEEA